MPVRPLSSPPDRDRLLYLTVVSALLLALLAFGYRLPEATASVTTLAAAVGLATRDEPRP